MKKFFVLAVIVALFASMAVASAEDLGVQVIGEENGFSQAVSLDDLKLEQVYSIDDYAKIKPVVWQFRDFFYQYSEDHVGDHSDGGKQGNNPYSYSWGGNRYYYKYIDIMRSGVNAEFAWLEIDFTNKAKSDVNFADNVEVKVVYDDEYEFAGWVRSQNYDYDTNNKDGELIRAAIPLKNTEMTSMMYTVHMVFGCTLPNAVVEDKAPLRMEILIDGNELTYNIRK